jgi:hypothetical protein
VKPFGSRPAPKKPWEKVTEAPSATIEAGGAEPTIDQEFPPLEAISHVKETEASSGMENAQGDAESADLPKLEMLDVS